MTRIVAPIDLGKIDLVDRQKYDELRAKLEIVDTGRHEALYERDEYIRQTTELMKERKELLDQIADLKLDVLGLTVTNKELMKDVKEKLIEVRFLGFRLYRRETR